jgi:hypothetical protein
MKVHDKNVTVLVAFALMWALQAVAIDPFRPLAGNGQIPFLNQLRFFGAVAAQGFSPPKFIETPEVRAHAIKVSLGRMSLSDSALFSAVSLKSTVNGSNVQNPKQDA